MPLQVKALLARGGGGRAAEFIPCHVLRPNLTELNGFVEHDHVNGRSNVDRSNVILSTARGLAGILIKKFFHYRLSRR